MIVLLALLIAVPGLAGPATTPPSGLGQSRGPAPCAEEPPPWTDSLDDLGHVYVPEGGLVNVEVTGGEARLRPGETEGWIASEVITCPVGNRYDFVLLEADLPGSSSVQISILNASKESSEIGFANETITPHVKVNGTNHSIDDIWPGDFPKIRIQVDLIASGTNRPRLTGWRLYYVPLDEWRDDFLGTGKMSDYRGLNLTGDTLEVNSSQSSPGGWIDYEPYPTIACLFNNDVKLFYPNLERTGYQSWTSIDIDSAEETCFNDFDDDGHLDLVVAVYTSTSKIFWGDETNTYHSSDMFELTTSNARAVDSGDLNGDGWPDLVFASGSSSGSQVFINHRGIFNSQADIVFAGIKHHEIKLADVNGDGYDDVVFRNENSYNISIFYGGQNGPDTTLDVTFHSSQPHMRVKDVNQDGFSDILLNSGGRSILVHLGSISGPNTTPFVLSTTGAADYPDAGDVNGDGYLDIVTDVLTYTTPTRKVDIFEGAPDGWNTTRVYNTIPSGDYVPSLITVVDINVDGYADILVNDDSGNIRIFNGGTSWPSTSSLTLPTGGTSHIAVAVPHGGTTRHLYRGFFVTNPIILPSGQKWDLMDMVATIPQNTSIRFSVLDQDYKVIGELKDLEMCDLNLEDIQPNLPSSIRIKVTLESEFNWTTPVLERLTVKWMDKGTWRDQFYGSIKAERMQNLGIVGGALTWLATTGAGPQLLITGLRSSTGYGARPMAYLDAGALDYAALAPIPFEAIGTSATDEADVNGDGFADVAFAVRQTGDVTFDGQSPLFLGSAVGWKGTPDFKFPTTGASEVLLRDLNGDGNVDVVFAQEYDGTTYYVNSTLFWGKIGGGWNATPDVQFATNGASGVAVADLDSDGDLDLAFSCRRDETTTSTNSMVFMQDANGFCGTVPSYFLPTRGAAAVDSGDVNDDGCIDLAFANSAAGGSVEIDSYAYLGKAGGGFEALPLKLRTSGAEDVALADVDGDGDLDAVFANTKNNLGSYKVNSAVYLNDGSGNFPATPSIRLPTTGAVAVSCSDIDGTGWKDLAFACQYNGTSYNVSSVVYLGGNSGWPTSPDIVLPTVGASDVLVAHLLKVGVGGYMSKAITPEDTASTGAFHTFRYTAALGTEQSGKVQLVDAATWEVLAETPFLSGTHEWLVRDAFKFKEHQSVRVLVTATGLDKPGEFALDDLWLNWTPRVKQPPRVLGVDVSPRSVLRLATGSIALNVTDEYDPTRDLRVTLEHRLNGTSTWTTVLFNGMPTFSGGAWRVSIYPFVSAQVGSYDLRAQARDMDAMASGYVEFPNALEVRNNVPTAPEVRIGPVSPVTTSTLVVETVRPSTDVESAGLTYHYRWYRDGEPVSDITGDTVGSERTTKGENWSVEVRAYDGMDESLPALAWAVIRNSGPVVKRALPNPELEEDTTDDLWLNLAGAFEDPDGDQLTWSVSPTPLHITVAIDSATGKVTLVPVPNWNGEESVTFVASDGQLSSSQTVLVTVTAVDDIPVIDKINGQPVTSDPISFMINQGELLVIQLGTSDVEGDELLFSVNSTAVQIDESTGEVHFQPGNDVVGTIRFAVTMTELKDPTVKVRLNFAITVLNVNDPPADPQITSPRAGARYKVDTNFTLVGLCTDPDTAYGQVLNYTWSVNGTPRWYGPSVTVSFKEPGNYTITLTVSDGEFQRSASVGIEVTKDTVVPPPVIPPEEEHKETPYTLIVGVIVAICVIMLVAFMLVSRRRAAELEAKDEAQEKREAFEHMAAEVGATAAQMEREVAVAKAATPAEPAKPPEPTKVIVETRGPDGSVVVASTGVPEQTLAIQPKETEAASKETEKLFSAIGEAEVSAEEQERLRVENLKRKYQTAISRLPYGIPSAELKGKDWTWIAGALATGERKEAPDGRELTLIEGRWYFSDIKDASTFLTEHGTKPKAEQTKAPPKSAVAMTDRATLLKKLDERYILGEISEEKYEELKSKLGG